jgi:hypothetical protein
MTCVSFEKRLKEKRRKEEPISLKNERVPRSERGKNESGSHSEFKPQSARRKHKGPQRHIDKFGQSDSYRISIDH